MKRVHWLRSCPVVLALALAVPGAAAGQTPLAQVPAGSPVVVSVRGVKGVKDRLLALVKTALPDQAPVVQTALEALLKQLLAGRQLAGLKDDGPVFLVFSDLSTLASDKPAAAAVLAVTDYKTFRDGLLTETERKDLKEDKTAGYEVAPLGTRSIYFIQKPGYAVVTLDPKTAAAFARSDNGKGLDSTLPRDLADKLLEADVACYVDLVAVRAKYGKQIKDSREFFEKWLESEGDVGLSKATLDMLKAVSAALFQVIEDGTSVLLSCKFDPQGLAVHAQVGVADTSKSNQFLKTLKPSPLAELAALPVDQTTYTAIDFGPEAYKAVHPLVKHLLASADEEGDDKQYQAVQKALDEMVTAGPRFWLTCTQLGAGRAGLEIGRCADPDKATAAHLKLMRALKKGGEYQFVPLKDKVVLKTGAEKYRGARLHHARLPWDLDRLAEDLPSGEEAARALKKMYGESLNLWFGTVDKRFVQVSARDWKTAQRYLDQYFATKKAVGADKAFAETRARLPREATLVSLTNVSRYMQFWGELLATPVKKGADRYLGVAVTLQAGQGSFDLWVPATSDLRPALELFKPREGRK